MIKIIHNELDSIAELHYVACSNYITPRLDFYIDLFDSLGNKRHGNNRSDLSQLYGIPNVSIQTLIDPFLKPKFKSKGRTRNISISQIATALNANSNNVIADPNNLDKFKQYHSFFKSVISNLHNILTGDPAELEALLNSHNYDIQTKQDIKEGLEIVFSYETFTKDGFNLRDGIKWNNYSLTQNLNLTVCPYCNRNWINTVTEVIKEGAPTKITSPQLDHFLSKSKFPLLRLSFYNLIPSCETCNARLKKDIDFSLTTHLHPYYEGYGQNAKFKTTPLSLDATNGLSTDYKIELEFTDSDPELKNRVNNHHKIFKINEIYGKHGDIIADVYQRRQIYTPEHLRALREQFPDMFKDEAELFRLAFGNYFYEKDFKKRPFAKLTKDVTEQLGILIPEK